MDIDPDLGSKAWVFQLQRLGPDAQWRDVGKYKTQGAKETRRFHLKPGTYRIHVLPGHGFAQTYSETFLITK